MEMNLTTENGALEVDLAFFDPDAEMPLGELAAEAYLAGCGCGCGCAGSAGSAAGCVGCAGSSTSGSLACCCCCCCCCFTL